MDKKQRDLITALLKSEVLPATGCTEPAAVALCVAKTCETLGAEPQKISLRLSKNVYKNAMGVGIPGSGMIGLPIAVAMAATHGRSERGLEVLTLEPNEIADARRWLQVNERNINISALDTADKLYVECTCTGTDGEAVCVIAHSHTHFTFISHNGKVLLDEPQTPFQPDEDDECPESGLHADELTADMVYEYATSAPIDELSFMRPAVAYNDAASEEGLTCRGLHTGQMLMKRSGGDAVCTVIARTVAASDARMDGCTKPVYSNSGSGNQGILCSLPPYYYG